MTLIWGATDTITPIAQGVHLERVIPGAKLVTIPRAGHGPQLEEPRLFEAALRDALGFADADERHNHDQQHGRGVPSAESKAERPKQCLKMLEAHSLVHARSGSPIRQTLYPAYRAAD